MMTKLVRIADKNIIFSTIIRVFVFISTHVLSCLQEICGFFRSKTHFTVKYKKLKRYKNKFFGERCFIVCTGPSLKVEDLELLKNEYTFGMNSLCLIGERTDFRPTFYGIIDTIVFEKFKETIKNFANDQMTVFTVDRVRRKNKELFDYITLPFNVAYHTFDRWFKHKYWCKFSSDCFRITYDMYSVTHLLIQLAVYMGFKEIYLLGADCTFEKNKNTHFIEYGTLDKDFNSAEERCLAGYLPIKEFIDANPEIRLYNATRGGKLELFPRISLEDVLEKDE